METRQGEKRIIIISCIAFPQLGGDETYNSHRCLHIIQSFCLTSYVNLTGRGVEEVDGVEWVGGGGGWGGGGGGMSIERAFYFVNQNLFRSSHHNKRVQ